MAQFMARRILLHNSQLTTGCIAHEAFHDIESLIWVLLYCIMRNLYHRASQGSAPKEVHNQCHAFRYLLCQTFGQTITKAIALQRQSGSYGLTFPGDPEVNQIITNFTSDVLVALFRDIEGHIYRAMDPLTDTSPLTPSFGGFHRLESLP
jgi:hypothetical protein